MNRKIWDVSYWDLPFWQANIGWVMTPDWTDLNHLPWQRNHARVLMVTWDYHDSQWGIVMLMGNSHVTWDYHMILMFNVGDSYHDSQWGLSGDSHG